MTVERDPLPELLQQSAAGDTTAASRLFELLYGDLRARAQQVGQRANSTLQPTALVHEAWLRLADRERPFADRAHFLRAAARAMRSVLVDHLRARATHKRGGDRVRVELDDVADVYDQRAVDLLVVDEAMQRLAAVDPELAQLVELRFFAGLQMQEIAAVLGTSLSGVERAWRLASAFLRAELADR